MTVQNLVKDYFNREAKRFDTIYVDEKPFAQRVVDSMRRVVVERFELLCNLAPSAGPWTALDVGCGSGRYSIAFAEKGASRVVGVDVAASMTDLANEEAERAGVLDRCEFVTAPFLDFESEERFDVIVAMGYFDYLQDPVEHLSKMLKLSGGRLFMSIPKRWEVRVPTRKLRFAIEKGFVRFYSRGEVDQLMARAGVPDDRWSLIDLGRDWIAVVRVKP